MAVLSVDGNRTGVPAALVKEQAVKWVAGVAKGRELELTCLQVDVAKGAAGVGSEGVAVAGVGGGGWRIIIAAGVVEQHTAADYGGIGGNIERMIVGIAAAEDVSTKRKGNRARGSASDCDGRIDAWLQGDIAGI